MGSRGLRTGPQDRTGSPTAASRMSRMSRIVERVVERVGPTGLPLGGRPRPEAITTPGDSYLEWTHASLAGEKDP